MLYKYNLSNAPQEESELYGFLYQTIKELNMHRFLTNRDINSSG